MKSILSWHRHSFFSATILLIVLTTSLTTASAIFPVKSTGNGPDSAFSEAFRAAITPANTSSWPYINDIDALSSDVVSISESTDNSSVSDNTVVCPSTYVNGSTRTGAVVPSSNLAREAGILQPIDIPTPKEILTDIPLTTMATKPTGDLTLLSTCPVVSIPNLTVLNGAPVTIPINTSDLTGLGAFSADFHITYDPTVLSLAPGPGFGITLGNVGNSNGGHTLTVNSPVPGLLEISIFGIYEFQGSGDLVNLNFPNVIGAAGAVSPVTFAPFANTPAGFKFNEATPCSTTVNGGVMVSGSITGTVTYGNVLTPPLNRFVPNVLISGVGQSPVCADVSIPNLTLLSGSPVTIPVNTSEMTALGALSADFHVTYDPAVLSLATGPNFGVTLGTVGNSNWGGRMLTVSNPVAGLLKISVFGTDEFQGSGDLVKLNFSSVIGLPGTFSSVSFSPFANTAAGFKYNEGTPCSATNNGRVTVGGQITGTATYGDALTPPTSGNVQNSLTNNGESSSVSTLTGPLGTYSLSGFGSGAYTIQTFKFGGQNDAITSLDAAIIARYIVGLIPFNSNQKTVADVSGNGLITSFDVAEVANYVVTNAPSGSTGNWIFNPANRTYSAVTSDFRGQDYSALLMGEISGNWTNTGARPPNSGPERSTSVKAPHLVTQADDAVIIPVGIEGISEKGIIAYQFCLRYDPSVIQPQKNPIDLGETVSSGLSTAANAKEPGLLRVAVYGLIPINGNGVLLNLRFTAVGAPGAVSPLTWENIMFNEGDPGTMVTDGQVELSAAAPNQAEIGGRLLNAMGQGVPNARVTLTDSTGQSRSIISNGFGVYRFGGLQVGQTYTISVESRRLTFTPLTVSVTDQLVGVDMIAEQ